MKTKSAKGILDSPVQYLPGVGPHRATLFERLGIKTVRDVLFYFPRRYIDARSVTRISDISIGEKTTIVGKVIGKNLRKARRGPQILTILVSDETGTIECVWFGRTYLERRFNAGDILLLVGRARFYQGIKFYPEEEEKLYIEGTELVLGEGKVIPVYGATQGLHHKTIRRIIERAIRSSLSQLDETLPSYLLESESLPTLRWAVYKMHSPADTGEWERSKKRLAFEEFLYLELILALRHKGRNARKGIPFKRLNTLVREFWKSLPFRLTKAQESAIKSIYRFMESESPMNVLVQGDVGSGKTVVALFAIMRALENGYQAALMAPTEVLAEQHARTISEMISGLDIKFALLTGAVRGRDRKSILSMLSSHEPVIIIGTHALIQEGVSFRNLGLVVVDEQHRFGVHQRVQLVEKGSSPDCLVMTATPIPRSLAMTLYGDLDVVVIDELPPGRQKVVTKIVSEEKRKDVYEFIRQKIREGDQVFAIYPLIEPSDKLGLKDASQWHERFKKEIFPEFRVHLIHGRMSHQMKEEAMRLFTCHELDILVSTTVVEVGVDVPQASIMIIEHAERFGLSQLHQLRGRIGRGRRKGYCILFTKDDIAENSRERLEAFCHTTDGFRIAEADLKLRGPGELIGTKQHGIPSFKVADLVEDYPILERARTLAFGILKDDPQLGKEKNAILRRELIKRHARGLRLLKIG
ncbi:MAG: ATP-dependent DNA helicase RecG [Candidatus Glassbacteria bacterium]